MNKMTEQEAIKYIRSKACDDRCYELRCNDSCMHGVEYCAFSMAIKAFEKQIAKKPAKSKNEYDEVLEESVMLHYCSCGNEIWRVQRFCDFCGQKLDWE